MVTYAFNGESDQDFLTVNVNVVDVNEAPVIELPPSGLSILENATLASQVLTLNVTDPDASAANGSAAYRNITEVSLVLTGGLSSVIAIPGWMCVRVCVCVCVCNANRVWWRVMMVVGRWWCWSRGWLVGGLVGWVGGLGGGGGRRVAGDVCLDLCLSVCP